MHEPDETPSARPGRPPTSIDVARAAGVSQPTVSRAFDPRSPISDRTRQRVLAVARDLGYQPNVIARSLSTQRTNIVGIVMANLTVSLFYPDVLERFTARLQERGKQVLLFKAPAERPVDEILPRVLGYQVDALVIASTTPGDAIIDECVRRGMPVVLFNRLAPGTGANAVCCDNAAGGRLAADLLYAAGHRRFGYLAGSAGTATNRAREAGFVDRLAALGVNDVVRAQGAYTFQSGVDAARKLLSAPARPDAIFCAADIMALGALDCARHEFGLRVPEALSIVGFDDVPAAAWPSYALTTIRQPVEAMVDAALDLIDAQDGAAARGVTHLLPGELIVRGSARMSASTQDKEAFDG